MMTTAYIIGNGVSRKNFNLESLRGLGKIFGCNALYRDFDPDYLVAIDDKIIKEITEFYHNKNQCIFPPEEERYEPPDVYGLTSGPTPRSNAGIVAMQYAIKMGFKQLKCLGFDFLVVDNDVATSNIYENTNAYDAQTKTSLSDTRNRMRFLGWLIEKNPNIEFVFMYPKNTKIYVPVCDNVKVEYYGK